MIQDCDRELWRRDLRVHGRRSTGGSTGQPLQFPVCREELQVMRLNLWLGRRLFGIRPSSRLFLIWGHSHALGPGIRGQFSNWWRGAADSALGYHRWSAYDLSTEAMRAAGEAILEFKPNYLLGYSVALDRLARANCDRTHQFHQLGLRAAIATAEGFPRSDSATRLAEVFGCRVIMEYGAVETGPMAYGAYNQPYRIFWRDFYLETLPVPGSAQHYELLVTALFPRILPLLRYRIGDLVDSPLGFPGYPREIGRVIGRCNDFVELADGSIVHSEAFSHAIKVTPAVSEFQVCQQADGSLRFYYRALRELSIEERRLIQARLARVHPELAETSLMRCRELQQTVAGKTRMILKATD